MPNTTPGITGLTRRGADRFHGCPHLCAPSCHPSMNVSWQESLLRSCGPGAAARRAPRARRRPSRRRKTPVDGIDRGEVSLSPKKMVKQIERSPCRVTGGW